MPVVAPPERLACPLRKEIYLEEPGDNITGRRNIEFFLPCLLHECAWYNITDQECSLLSIANSSIWIRDDLNANMETLKGMKLDQSILGRD